MKRYYKELHHLGELSKGGKLLLRGAKQTFSFYKNKALDKPFLISDWIGPNVEPETIDGRIKALYGQMMEKGGNPATSQMIYKAFRARRSDRFKRLFKRI